jgi:hypothetical protein
VTKKRFEIKAVTGVTGVTGLFLKSERICGSRYYLFFLFFLKQPCDTRDTRDNRDNGSGARVSCVTGEKSHTVTPVTVGPDYASKGDRARIKATLDALGAAPAAALELF